MCPNVVTNTAEVDEDEQTWFSVHPPEAVEDAWLAWESDTGQLLVIRQPSGTTYEIQLYADPGAKTLIGTVATVNDTTYDGTSALASARRFRA
jgi:hypothetical protein